MATKLKLIHRLDRAERNLPAPVALAPEPIRLQSSADVLALVEEQVNAVRSDRSTGPLPKARALGRLASLALKAIEVHQLAVRLEMLEAVLKMRGENQR